MNYLAMEINLTTETSQVEVYMVAQLMDRWVIFVCDNKLIVA